VLCQSVDPPLAALCAGLNRPVYVAIGGGADAGALHQLERAGARVLLVTHARQVEGRQLVYALSEQGFRSIYSIAGPGVIETLLRDGVLDRLYLTQVHRLIEGESYDTLLEGDLLTPPADFTLNALYYNAGKGIGQLFGVYDAVQRVPRARTERADRGLPGTRPCRLLRRQGNAVDPSLACSAKAQPGGKCPVSAGSQRKRFTSPGRSRVASTRMSSSSQVVSLCTVLTPGESSPPLMRWPVSTRKSPRRSSTA